MPKLVATALVLAAGLLMGAAAPTTSEQGYLPGPALPDTLKILPPAPVAGTSRYETDRTVYLQTRSMQGSPRWALAQTDIKSTAYLRDLGCAAGVDLSPEHAPKFATLLKRLSPDVRRAVDLPKDHYQSKRPYLVDEGPICDAKTADLAASPNYPSGHTTWSWAVGLILAELAPDRATDILVRARSFGESRLVCGVHSLSAIEAGRTNGAAVVATLHGSPEFRRDLDAARAEIASLRKAGPPPGAGGACQADAALAEKSPY